MKFDEENYHAFSAELDLLTALYEDAVNRRPGLLVSQLQHVEACVDRLRDAAKKIPTDGRGGYRAQLLTRIGWLVKEMNEEFEEEEEELDEEEEDDEDEDEEDEEEDDEQPKFYDEHGYVRAPTASFRKG